MIDREQLKQRLHQLFASQKLAVLSTQQQGQPYASLIAFAASDDLKELYFATPRATRKYAYLEANPKVALLIDSRSNQDSDIHQAIAATAVGKAMRSPGSRAGQSPGLLSRQAPSPGRICRIPFVCPGLRDG